MKGLIAIVPMLMILLILVLGVSFFLAIGEVLEIVRVVLIILAFPLLLKFFADYFGNRIIGLDQTYSLILGGVASVIISIVLYINFYALVIMTTVLVVLYFIARAYIPGFGLFSEWFVEETRRK